VPFGRRFCGARLCLRVARIPGKRPERAISEVLVVVAVLLVHVRRGEQGVEQFHFHALTGVALVRHDFGRRRPIHLVLAVFGQLGHDAVDVDAFEVSLY